MKRKIGDRTIDIGPIGPNINLDEEEVYLADGTRLTEAEAEALAQRAITAARPGRPSVTGGSERTPNLTIRVQPAVRRALQAIADTQGRRLADIGRDALAEYAKRHGRAGQAAARKAVPAPKTAAKTRTPS